MLRPILIGLLFWLSQYPVLAQDTTLVLSTSQFTEQQSIHLSELKGWLYKVGHNPGWASQRIDTRGWTKRQPGSLSALDASTAGKVEGWFRLRIRLDSSFTRLALGLGSSSWAASEVYVNGQWTVAFGNTGTGEKPYVEYDPNLKPPLAIPLEAGKDYLIAIHIVDYVALSPPFAPKKLISQLLGSTNRLLWLSRPEYTSRLLLMTKLQAGFNSIWLTASVLLAVLFWLLSSQELPEKKTIRLWAIVETLFILLTLSYSNWNFNTAFVFAYFLYAIQFPIRWLIFSLGMVAFLRVFGYRIPGKWMTISVLASLGAGMSDLYFDTDGSLFSVASICGFLVLIYLITVFPKRVKGAQWAVVTGVGLTGIFTLLHVFFFFTTGQPIDLFLNFILTTGTILSLPLSFLIYLVLRFKETVAEVRTNATAVVKVTQEKRDLLASQNERLEQQVEARTAELKASQQQLIQKEKMASLGELTAGIAHEIQNPLNFVNNFSAVSAELVTELEEEHGKPNRDAQLEAQILVHLKQNLQKINHHGGRASVIVRDMLEHARTKTGERRPTDLNGLANEYLKIAYHGLRAKDKDFNAELVTDFGSGLSTIEVVPQEIGRVLLNLYNNAFYAVHQRKKGIGYGEAYRPTVTVITRHQNGCAEIRIIDNGTGIPESIKAKIFQPFFTTKPTGEGTGLGLSLSYDIVTKGHGGRLTVESQEDQGSTFVIQLPTLS